MFRIIYGYCPNGVADDRERAPWSDLDVANFLDGEFAIGMTVEDAYPHLLALLKENGLTVRTYNPLTLNFLTEEEACDVVWFYSKKDGVLRRMFDVPYIRNKLRAMSPGEVACDTYLEDF